MDELAENAVVLARGEVYEFGGIGEDNAVEGASALYQGYLKEGSLKLVIEAKEEEQIDCQLQPGSPGCPDPDPKPDSMRILCRIYVDLQGIYKDSIRSSIRGSISIL